MDQTNDFDKRLSDQANRQIEDYEQELQSKQSSEQEQAVVEEQSASTSTGTKSPKDFNAGDNIKELGKLTKGWVILHHKAGSVCTDGDKLFETKVSVIENVNVLGAGDMFAASFINEQLTTSLEFKKIVINSHRRVTNYLESIVNEKN